MNIKPIDLARFIVEKTNYNLFLTGKAGTGKSTFIREITNNTKKKYVVLAPTGIAAINVGGMTIHSFFLMDYAPFLPNACHEKKAIKNERQELIKALDLIIIDEISMVRADILDQIDYRLRSIRENTQPFGGVQLLMVGDPLQLEPVVKKVDADILKQAYCSPYFFNSEALKQSTYYCINLEEVHRQTNQAYIDILNRARLGAVTYKDISILNSRYIPDFVPKDEGRYVTLVTHNTICDAINEEEMSKISGNARSYEAAIIDSFPISDFPTHKTLTLKEGARIVFLKNASNQDFINGSMGTVVSLNDSCIEVTLDDGRDVEVTPETWEKIEYTYQ